MPVNSYIFSDSTTYDKPVRQGSALVQNINDENKRLYYQTTAASTHILNFGSEGEVDSVYIAGTNIASYRVGIGTGTLASGSMDVTENGIQYALSTDNTIHTGNAMTLTITPTDATMPVRLHDVKLMKQLYHFPDGTFSQEPIRLNRRGSVLKEAFNGRLSRTTPTVNYNKHGVSLTIEQVAIQVMSDLQKVFDDNIHFVYCYEWPDFPGRVFSALVQDDINISYPQDWTEYGTQWDYVVLER